MKKSFNNLSIILGAVAILTACVTINIYFPAAAAEKAADKIIDEVWQLKQGADGANKSRAKPDAKPDVKPSTKAPATNKPVAPPAK